MHRESLSRNAWFRLAIDVGLTWMALLLADVIRRAIPFGRDIGPGTIYLTPAIFLMAGLMWCISFTFFDVHGAAHRRPLDEVRVVVSAISVAALLFIGGIYLTRTRDFSRLLVAYFVALDVILLLGFRWIYRVGAALSRESSGMTQRTVIVGMGPTALEVERRIEWHPYAGFRLIGYVTTGNDEAHRTESKHPILGRIDDLAQIVAESDVECVILALPIAEAEQTTPAILRLQNSPTRVYIVPDYVGMVSLESRIDDLFGVPLISLSHSEINGRQRFLKRAIDLFFSVSVTTIMLPLLGILAIAIRLDSPGPALFVQERVGKDGKIFKMLKFRSMVTHAEDMLGTLLDEEQREKPPLKLNDDPRITRLGRILRRTSLDELPQLFNVVTGDMSLVGPRPEEPRIVQTYTAWQRKRLAVKPGLTGPMQVNGRADLPLDDRVRLELDYIQNYSVFEDLWLLIRTLPAVISGRGSY